MGAATTGTSTSVAWGQFRISALSGATGGSPTANLIDTPPTLEDQFRAQEPGSFGIDDITATIVRQDQQLALLAAQNVRTAYPWVVFLRGTAGNLCTLVEDVRMANVPDGQAVGEPRSNDYTFAAGGGGEQQMHISAGMLFDHTIAHAAGVTATTDGAVVQVGAVSATQSVIVYFGNLHSPTATVSGGEVGLYSDPIAGFTTATQRGTTVTGISSTASYEVQTIAGPITDTYWRWECSAITSGGFYPVCCMWIIDDI